MNELDLDIGNYSIKDMEKFFQLKPNYTATEVEYNETRIREMLFSSGIIDKKMKRDLIEFLTTAKQWLIFVKCKPIEPPTALPTNPKLDKSDYPQKSNYSSYIEQHRQHDLIEKQKTQFVHTMPSEFQVGNLNPLHTRITTKCLTIDTRFRENYYTTMSSDINIQLPQKISKVVSMQLASMEIPLTFYGITDFYGNNYLNLEVVYQDTSLNQTITKTRTTTIPDGNYGGQDLVCVLNNLHAPMNSAGTGLANPRDIWSYIYFALDISEAGSGSGKIWIKSNMTDASNQKMQIQNVKLDCTRNAQGIVDNGDLSCKLSWLMGFTQRIYSGNTYYIAEAIVEPNPIRYIYLVVDDFNNSVNNHFISAYSSGVNNPNILARISIRGGYFCLIMDNDLNITTEPRRYFGPVDIQKLRVQLMDDRGRILDMNSSNYSFCLNFKTLYDL
jgi:hypothetical protein